MVYFIKYFQMIDGRGEMFGTELAKNRKYTFVSGSKVAVYTWHGCTIQVLQELYKHYL